MSTERTNPRRHVPTRPKRLPLLRRGRLIAIPLLPLLYALQVWRREFGAVHGGEVAVFVLVYLLPAAFLCSMVAIRRKASTAFIATLTMALLLYWDLWARQSWLVAHVPLFNVGLVACGYAALLVLALRWLFIRFNNETQRKVLLVLNGTVVLSVLVEAGLLAAMRRPPEPAFTRQDAVARQPAAAHAAPQPNVYLIVFDEYALHRRPARGLGLRQPRDGYVSPRAGLCHPGQQPVPTTRRLTRPWPPS